MALIRKSFTKDASFENSRTSGEIFSVTRMRAILSNLSKASFAPEELNFSTNAFCLSLPLRLFVVDLQSLIEEGKGMHLFTSVRLLKRFFYVFKLFAMHYHTAFNS